MIIPLNRRVFHQGDSAERLVEWRLRVASLCAELRFLEPAAGPVLGCGGEEDCGVVGPWPSDRLFEAVVSGVMSNVWTYQREFRLNPCSIKNEPETTSCAKRRPTLMHRAPES